MKGEGAQKQRTHTPRQENAHIDTVWEQRGAGTLKVWARVYSKFGFFFQLQHMEQGGFSKRCSEGQCLTESFSYGSARY